MATELVLPELGENIESGDVVKVLVSVGDTIQQEQSVLELETDKATIELPSSVSGKIKEIFVKEGEKIKVGQKILTVDAAADAQAASEKKPELKQEEEKAPKEEQKKDDTAARKADEAAETEGEKPEAVESGKQEVASFPRRVVSQPADGSAGRSDTGASAGGSGSEARQAVAFHKVAPAAPSVRRLAREIGIDINEVPGSGPDGRISMEDVKEYARRLSERRGGVAQSQAPAVALPDFSKWGEIERKPMSNVRRKTAEHMSYAWSTIPQVTQFDQSDITQLEKLRERFGKKVEAAGGKLTVTAIVLKVAAAALKVFPQFNASLDMSREEIIFKKYIHIGVAVDTERGLLVPVIRDVDKKNITSLSVELSEIAEKARNKKIVPEEMQGGSFTITNLGGIGGTGFSPIVNSPEVAILGIARGSTEPVFVDGRFEPRLMLPLSLSYDHRLIDGADAARFLRWIAGALEQPFLIALEG